jgi:RNA polymerase sigma-70 factor (ECF subfamily)
VHDELRRLARRHMKREKPEHTLQPTALVNEAYLRLVNLKRLQWEDRNHFFAIAARLMRRILVDSARARRTHKRGDGVSPVQIEDVAAPPAESDPDHALLELEKALLKLETMDARKARVVELRFFTGLSVEETGQVLGVSPRTIKRDWLFAKAWLSSQLSH